MIEKIKDMVKDYEDLIELNRKELQFSGFVSPDILRSETKMAKKAIKDLELTLELVKKLKYPKAFTKCYHKNTSFHCGGKNPGTFCDDCGTYI